MINKYDLFFSRENKAQHEVSRPRRQSSCEAVITARAPKGRPHASQGSRAVTSSARKKKNARPPWVTLYGGAVQGKNMSHTRGGQAVVRQVARTTHSYRMGHGGAEVTDRAGSIPQNAKGIEGGSRRPHSAPLATTSPGGAGVLRRLLRPLFVLLFGL